MGSMRATRQVSLLRARSRCVLSAYDTSPQTSKILANRRQFGLSCTRHQKTVQPSYLPARMQNLVVYFDEHEKLCTKLETTPVPSQLQPHEVLIKVSVAGSNPKDWKHPLPYYFNNRLNQGDDCCGTIAAVGSAVRAFKVGERVAGFHEMDTENGTYAEYAVCPQHTVFRVPESMSDEEAATLPLAMFTASVGLYRNLGLPAPWDRSDAKAPSTGKVPLVVNAGSTAVGAFAIRLAKLNPRVGPIVATAGSSQEFVRSLGVDAVVDYRSSTAAEDIKKAVEGQPIRHVFDAYNSISSIKYLTSVLEKDGKYTCVTAVGPSKLYGEGGEMEKMLEVAGVWYEPIWIGEIHEYKKAGGQLFGAVMSRVIEDELAAGRLSGHPHEIVQEGLHGVLGALQELRDRKRGGNAKFVTRISDTPEVRDHT